MSTRCQLPGGGDEKNPCSGVGPVLLHGCRARAKFRNGGSIGGIVKAMDDLIATLDDNTKVIPGHGPLSGKKDVIAYRNMIATIGARVETLVKQGKSLEEVRAAKPTRDFDDLWGKQRSGDQFVDFVYYGYAPYRQ